MNEKDFIRELLVSKEKPNDIAFSYLVTLIAKYYFYNCSSPIELCSMVKEKLSEFNLRAYQEYRYHDMIEKICKSLFETGDVNFKEIEYIPIYEHETEIIETLDSEKKKKVMFTLFILARYANSNGWVNKKTSKEIGEIFRLANVNMTIDARDELLHELYQENYITFAKRVENLNIHVELDDSGEVAYKVKEINDLGYQYAKKFKGGYRICACCGRSVKMKSSLQRYCPKCAKKRQAEQNREWQKIHRTRTKQK